MRKMLTLSESNFTEGTSRIKIIGKIMLYPVAKLIGAPHWAIWLDRFSQRIKFENSYYIGGLVWGYGPQERMVKAKFLPYSDVSFEDRKFHAPKCWHIYLKNLYGNYMKYPPKNKRLNHSMTAWKQSWAVNIMYIYYILLFIISFLGFIFFKDGTTPKRNKYFLICSFFLLFLVQSLRKYTVGVDVPTYVEGFYQIRNMPWNDCRLHDWEPLYAYLNKLIGCFTNRYSVLLSAASFIILVGCGYFIYKNSTNVFWPVFLFIVLDNFFISMYSLRQFCAIAIGINIYTVLKENTSVKNYIKAGILFLLAIMFHVTAFVCILFFAVFWAGKMSRFKLILWLLIGIFGILYFSKIGIAYPKLL